MNKQKAEKKIRRKISRLKKCPFCGSIPVVNAYCDEKHSDWGSLGHYVVRDGCCSVTGLGKTELFFCNNFKKPDYKLWWRMVNQVVSEWNRRIN